MALGLRPAVALIAFASLLFIVAGWLDGGGEPTFSAIESWTFGAVNLLVAVFIARGNERILALRIGLAAFFMVERPVTAVALGPKPIESIALHMATAVVEVVILVSTMRLWRLGHSVSPSDLAFLSLPTVAPSPLAAAAASADLPMAGPVPAVAAPPPAAVKTKAMKGKPKAEQPLDATPSHAGWGIGLIALLLAGGLLADGVARGVVPGATVDLGSPDWLVYVFALVVLVVAARAVHGGRFAVRLLLVVSLITFVERGFTPFALRLADGVSLGLHAAAALLALGLALLCAASLRATRPRYPRPPLPL